MHRDLKLGLALAFLLIGATTAFFFRSETDPGAGLPQLQNPERLDIEIAGRDVIPYLGDPEADTRAISPWTKPAFLGGSSAPIRRTSVTPDPIRIPLDDEAEQIETGPNLPPQPVDLQDEINDESPAPAAGALTHTVQPGDTLSGLAATYLGSITRFGEIYDLNRDQLSGPNDLKVGMQLRIPARDQAVASSDAATTGNDDVRREIAADVESAETRPHAAAATETPTATDEHQKLFLPARKAPFVPGRYRSGGDPSAEADSPTDASRE